MDEITLNAQLRAACDRIDRALDAGSKREFNRACAYRRQLLRQLHDLVDTADVTQLEGVE